MEQDEDIALFKDILAKLAGEDGLLWMQEFRKFLLQQPCWVGMEAKKKAKTYLRPLFQANIPATKATDTLSRSYLFFGEIQGPVNMLPRGVPREATTAVTYDQIEDGTFEEMYGSLGETDELTEGQVIACCRENEARFREAKPSAIFFRLRGGFVGMIVFDESGRLKAGVLSFSESRIWKAEEKYLVVSLEKAVPRHETQ